MKISKTGYDFGHCERNISTQKIVALTASTLLLAYDVVANRWLGTGEGQRFVRYHRTNESHLHLWNDVPPAISILM